MKIRKALYTVSLVLFLSASAPAVFSYYPEPVQGVPGAVVNVTLRMPEVTDVSSDYAGISYTGGGTFSLRMPASEGLKFIGITVVSSVGGTEKIDLPVVTVKIPRHVFVYNGPGSTVAVAGSFNGWNSSSDILQKNTSGYFELSMEIPPGSYQYKFVVDGKWLTDTANPDKSADGFGGFNSLLRIEEKSVKTPAEEKEEVSEGIWKMGFSYFEPSYKGYRIYLYAGGKARVKVYEGEPVEFSVPAGSGLAEAFLWASDRQGNVSKTVRIMKNFSKEPSWPQTVIYSIITDRFFNGDKSNDRPVVQEGLSPKANYMGGDFAGVIKKIDDGYFRRLGVNCLWMSPFADNTDKAFKDAMPPHRYFTGYHGYWPVSPVKVEEHFGTSRELKALIDDAHSHGIKIMADMVFNHVHEDHPWYRQHPGWFGTLDLPNGEKNLRKFDEHPFTTWFDSFLPSFDYSNPEAVKAVVDNAEWWVRTFNIDAFRLDAVKHIPYNFWKSLCRRVRDDFGSGFYMVGESIASRKTINSFIGPGLLDAQFDFPLYWHIKDTFAMGKEDFISLDKELKSSLADYKNDYLMSPLVGNQDFSRFMAYADGDLNSGDEKKIGWDNPPRVDRASSYGKIMDAFTFILTNPGVPMIYYGDEIGMTGAADPDNRRMMEFSGLKPGQKKVFERVSKLIAFRKAAPAVTMGRHTDLVVQKDLWIYMKNYFQSSAIAVFSKGGMARKITVKLPGSVPRSGRYRSVLTGKKYKIKNGAVKIKIPADGSDVLEYEK